jgi:NAD(P)H dehydrogenase (quinone)
VHVYVIYAHPARQSFCRDVLGAFVDAARKAGHSVDVHDLYADGFQSDMDEAQYCREVGGDPKAGLPLDIQAEHRRIAKADVLAFIFPNWWSDAPAKLKGWFDRVWSYGYAYLYEADGGRTSKIRPRKALVICSAGHTEAHLEETGIAESMRRIFLGDRLGNVGFTDARMEILGGMMPGDSTHRDSNLDRVRSVAGAL